MDRIENNTVYIGKKPMMNYVLAVVASSMWAPRTS